MRRLLVITAFFPPCAKSGVQRALRLGKYLREFGWEPVFLVPRSMRCGGRYDPELLEDVAGCRVIKTPNPMPFKEGEALHRRAARRLWGALTWPDPHVLWALSAPLFARKVKVDAIFATGWPFSAFITGAILKRKLGVPLILDFRDPWSDDPHLGRTFTGALERRLVAEADALTAPSPGTVNYLREKYPEKHVAWFPYSYEPLEWTPPPDGPFTLCFGGQAYGPQPFITVDKALEDLPGVALRVRGQAPVRRAERGPFLPKKDYFEFLRSCHAVLVANGTPEWHERLVLAGKLLDALAVGRPVLYVGVPGAMWELVTKYRVGEAARWDDPKGVREAILRLMKYPAKPYRIPELEAKRSVEALARVLDSLK